MTPEMFLTGILLAALTCAFTAAAVLALERVRPTAPRDYYPPTTTHHDRRR